MIRCVAATFLRVSRFVKEWRARVMVQFPRRVVETRSQVGIRQPFEYLSVRRPPPRSVKADQKLSARQANSPVLGF
jgi:hypothetical protein